MWKHFKTVLFRFVEYSKKASQNFNFIENDSKILIVGAGTIIATYYAINKSFPKDRLGYSKNLNNLKSHRDDNIDKTGHLILIEDTWLPEYMFGNLKLLKDIKQFKLQNDDILVVSFPKSGTTWVQEIVTQILNVYSNTSPDRKLNIEERFPYMEYPYPGLKALEKRQPPRLLKSHLPYNFMPEDVSSNVGKVLYIARQPKDVCVSYYYFIKMISFLHYKGTFSDFFKSFLNGEVAYGPWFDHVHSFWEHKNDENVLFLTYEELHMNAHAVVKRISEFLRKPLTDEQIKSIVDGTKFEKMKANPSVNYSWWDDLGIRIKSESNFMRKGVIGDHKNYMTLEMVEMMDNHLLSKKSIMNEIFHED